MWDVRKLSFLPMVLSFLLCNSQCVGVDVAVESNVARVFAELAGKELHGVGRVCHCFEGQVGQRRTCVKSARVVRCCPLKNALALGRPMGDVRSTV